MEYAILLKDYGQGGITAVPVSQCTGENKPDFRRPYTAYEVLTDFFGEDMSLVLGNYLKQEIKTVRKQKGMERAKEARLLSYYYLTTRSKAQQPVNETLVDFMIRGKVEAETGKIRQRLGHRAGNRKRTACGSCHHEQLQIRKRREGAGRLLLSHTPHGQDRFSGPFYLQKFDGIR